MNSPTPNNVTPNSVVQDHPRQRPGHWWALVRINADPTATAQQVREDIGRVVEVNLAEGESHCIEGVSICVDNRFGLHPDEGNDHNTVYWP